MLGESISDQDTLWHGGPVSLGWGTSISFLDTLAVLSVVRSRRLDTLEAMTRELHRRKPRLRLSTMFRTAANKPRLSGCQFVSYDA